MGALRRFAAILVADLRERSRSTRFWVVLTLVGIVTWGCFPGIESGQITVGFSDSARGSYSSAWVGLVLGLMYSSMLSLIGFFLVRGTLVRDFDTRVWQLLVATPMTRPGYLLAKWASHMVVFLLIMLVGVTVGAVAQWVRAEDRTFDLWELVKPVCVLTLPALALSAFFAVLFDLVPWLRRTMGNVLFVVLWLFLFAAMGSMLDPHNSAWARDTWLSDPSGMVMVMRDLGTQLGRTAPWVKVEDLSVGAIGSVVGTLHLFQWHHWAVHARDLGGRGLWVLLSMLGVVSLAPALDWAAAHTRSADAGNAANAANPGRRLMWLDRLLRPLESAATGMVAAAELKLVLRQRRAWWWLALAASWAVQGFGPPQAVGVAVIGAWLVSIDIFAREILRERETGTGPLLFAAAGGVRRLLAARVAVAVSLAVLSVAPALLHLLAIDAMAALALLLTAANVALAGMALGVLCRNPRPFELLLAVLAYVGVQGQGPLAVVAHPLWALQLHALLLPPLVAVLLTLWPRLSRGGQSADGLCNAA